MNYAVRGDMSGFVTQGADTAATAGAMAVGIVLAATGFRMLAEWKKQHKK